MSRISAAILAGGRATRLGGADKASLPVGGVRIVERQLAALAAVADDIRIVATGGRERYAGLAVRVVADAVDGAGPLGGLYTALIDARHDRVIVLAGDMPFVTTALLERLEAESRTGDQVEAVVPCSRRGLEPLCAVYRTACAARVKGRIDRGELQMRALLADLRVREIGRDGLAPGDEEALFENVNTPHDYVRARGLVDPDEKPYKDRITE